MLRYSLIAAAMVFAGSAFADEVIIHRDGADAPPPPPASSTTTVEKHGPDCDSKTVHAENDAGDSKTVTRTDCD